MIRKARKPDMMTQEQRSRCMSRIHGKNTVPEVTLRKALWKRGLRYRLHYKIQGKPDIAFPGKRLAVFVDGCFWHGCPVHGVRPKSNAEFWKSKIRGNIERDQRVTSELEARGWLVLRFWEHEVNDELSQVVSKIETALNVTAPPLKRRPRNMPLGGRT